MAGGAYVAGGHMWQGCAWQGACMAGGHTWLGAMHGGGVCGGGEACIVGKMVIAAGGTQTTGMHSC